MVFKRDDIDFGDYVMIEQKRYGCKNEMYIYKVIGRLESNNYIPVPVKINDNHYTHLHSEIEDVVACICCGIDETRVENFRLLDVKKLRKEVKPNE
jgi:hypothetical protein